MQTFLTVWRIGTLVKRAIRKTPTILDVGKITLLIISTRSWEVFVPWNELEVFTLDAIHMRIFVHLLPPYQILVLFTTQGWYPCCLNLNIRYDCWRERLAPYHKRLANMVGYPILTSSSRTAVNTFVSIHYSAHAIPFHIKG